MLGGAERAVQIDIDHPQELLLGHVIDVGIAPDPGRSNQNIDRPKRIGGELHHCLHIGLVCHVALKKTHPFGTKAGFRQQGKSDFSLGIRKAGNHCIGAALKQAQGAAKT